VGEKGGLDFLLPYYSEVKKVKIGSHRIHRLRTDLVG
jgi:hypothetical protein